jgi:hypothetical protein
MEVVGVVPPDPAQDDSQTLKQIEAEIIKHAKGWEKFRKDIPVLIRQALDEVIDAARSKRFTLDELEKTEKTYIGTKIEILLRNHLRLERGKVLDVSLGGVEVDIKNTIGSQWTIPLEALGHPCILIKESEQKAVCSFGLLVVREAALNPGKNRDKKSTLTKTAHSEIRWMLKNEPYPRNFWEDMEPPLRETIMKPFGGTSRVVNLFRELQGVPIARKVILAVACQKDALKRVRKNGGARDLLRKQGIAILSGKAHSVLIQQLGLPACTVDDFISLKPQSERHLKILREAGELD